ncbi:MAG: hypothetical protein RL213_130 [Bacteroidota bacterium]|jgi:HPt (histidine-containing phosphotransfer) domain-containing protein
MTPETKDWTDVLLYFVPAVLVLMGMFMLVKRFTDVQLSALRRMTERDLQAKAADERTSRRRESLPLKLQAYERLILLLERISPDSVIVRVHAGSMSAQLLHVELLAAIRAEFEHNLSQQLYVSDEVWEEVCSAKDAMASMVNDAYRRVGASATGVQLSAAVFEAALAGEPLATHRAIHSLKSEAQRLFN